MGAEHLKPWKPGVSGNPSGRPRLPDELRGIRSLTVTEVCKLVSKYAQLSHPELEAVIEAKTAPVLELAIAKIFEQSVRYGDYQRLAFLLDRSIGKAPVTSPDDDDESARKQLEGLSDRELLRLVKEKLPELEKEGA